MDLCGRGSYSLSWVCHFEDTGFPSTVIVGGEEIDLWAVDSPRSWSSNSVMKRLRDKHFFSWVCKQWMARRRLSLSLYTRAFGHLGNSLTCSLNIQCSHPSRHKPPLALNAGSPLPPLTRVPFGHDISAKTCPSSLPQHWKPESRNGLSLQTLGPRPTSPWAPCTVTVYCKKRGKADFTATSLSLVTLAEVKLFS